MADEVVRPAPLKNSDREGYRRIGYHAAMLNRNVGILMLLPDGSLRLPDVTSLAVRRCAVHYQGFEAVRWIQRCLLHNPTEQVCTHEDEEERVCV